MKKILAMVLAGGEERGSIPLPGIGPNPLSPLVPSTGLSTSRFPIVSIQIFGASMPSPNINRLPFIVTSNLDGTSFQPLWENSSKPFLLSKESTNIGIRGQRMPFSKISTRSSRKGRISSSSSPEIISTRWTIGR